LNEETSSDFSLRKETLEFDPRPQFLAILQIILCAKKRFATDIQGCDGMQ
jgi:hypothetical protein